MLWSSRYGVRGEGIAEDSRLLENREANTELGRQGDQDQAEWSHQGRTQCLLVIDPMVGNRYRMRLNSTLLFPSAQLPVGETDIEV